MYYGFPWNEEGVENDRPTRRSSPKILEACKRTNKVIRSDWDLKLWICWGLEASAGWIWNQALNRNYCCTFVYSDMFVLLYWSALSNILSETHFSLDCNSVDKHFVCLIASMSIGMDVIFSVLDFSAFFSIPSATLCLCHCPITKFFNHGWF